MSEEPLFTANRSSVEFDGARIAQCDPRTTEGVVWAQRIADLLNADAARPPSASARAHDWMLVPRCDDDGNKIAPTYRGISG